MLSLSKIYIIFCGLFTVTFYSLVIGKYGYMNRNKMIEKSSILQNDLSLLRSENRYLNEQYALFKKKANKEKKVTIHSKNNHITILKFEEGSKKDTNFFDLFSHYRGNLEQLRIFFLAFMLLIAFVGYLILHRVKKKQTEI